MLPTLRTRPRVATAVDGADAGRGRDCFAVHGTEAVLRLRQAIGEGNVRRIRIKDVDGRALIEIPTLLGVRDASRMEPVWAAIEAMASIAGTLIVEVKREDAWPSHLTVPR